ncbi:interleukin-10 receptor subunit beta-like [Brachyistius frenatus]|uniref:interleukin-10 receptor subunit beta-like n=1 Tax=Brachyistius frenatus TaxID=100188 RepID=UPI0037E84CAE
MPAAVCVFVLVFSSLCGSTAVSGLLSGPSNVRLTSYNMNLVLRWDRPEGGGDGLTYTTEYRSSVTEYRPGCMNTSGLQCDFTSFNVTVYGRYSGRVRAQLGAKSSSWVQSNEITLDKDSVIGPPGVSLLSNKATLEVSIIDPQFMISPLRHMYSVATYNITYWKDDQREKTRSIGNLQQNRVVLNDLEPWSKYCIQVIILTDRNVNPSEPSAIVCESTTNEEEAPWVAAVVAFVVMVAALVVVVLAVVYWRKIYQFLCPKDTLPEYLKDTMLVPLNSTIYLAMRDSHPVEEVYHPVSIVAVEERLPLEAAGSSCSE